MLTAADLARMRADLAEIVADRSVSVILRRGATTLPAQTVRVERANSRYSRLQNSASSEETRMDIVIVGSTTLDVQKDDRFTVDGVAYRVTSVRPNGMAGIQAEAERVE